MRDHQIFASATELPLDRYLAGDATPAQRVRIEAWLAENPLRVRLLTELRQAGEGPPCPVDLQTLSARIEHRLDEIDLNGRALKGRPQMSAAGTAVRKAVHTATRTPRRAWISFTLGLFAAIALGYASLRYTIERGIPSRSVAVTQTYTTQARQRATITLTDGSRVTLAPQTTLTLAPGFGVGAREVTVNGEAYFIVSRSERAPFLVNVGNTVTRVLGTTFVVRKFPRDTVTRIVVADGKVAVHSIQSKTVSDVQGVLTASTMAVVSDSGVVTLTSRVPIDDYTAWLDGRLVFRDASFRDAIDEIVRVYGTTIVADSALFKRRITLTVATSKRSLHEVLEVLAEIVGAHYTKIGDVVTIHPGSRASRDIPVPDQTVMEKRYGL